VVRDAEVRQVTKVEAVVVRDRVETVMEAVEEETGHVGVTVVEAVGHGPEKGITHEYRGGCWSRASCPRRT
jgi:nitrogen regulatory protein PII